jgi:hypothetical protein
MLCAYCEQLRALSQFMICNSCIQTKAILNPVRRGSNLSGLVFICNPILLLSTTDCYFVQRIITKVTSNSMLTVLLMHVGLCNDSFYYFTSLYLHF